MDANLPLEERELYEIRDVKISGKLHKQVYYRGKLALSLMKSPGSDGSQRLNMKFLLPDRLNIQALNIILRQLGINVSVEPGESMTRTVINRDVSDGPYSPELQMWYYYYEGSPFETYVWLDQHNPRNKSCMC